MDGTNTCKIRKNFSEKVVAIRKELYNILKRY